MTNYIMTKKTSDADRRHAAGFSLIELLVSMVVFLIVIGSVLGVLQVARQNRGLVNQQAELSKSVRVGLDLVGRDTYNAGYGYPLTSTVVLPDNRIAVLLGIPNDADNSRDTIPPIIAGNNITLNNINPVANTRTDSVTLLYKDTSFNLVGPVGTQVSEPLNINAATVGPTGIDEIVPLSGSNSACRVGDIFLITGNTGSTLGVATGLSGTDKVQFANGDVLGFNQSGLGGPINGITVPASMQRVRMVTFMVTSDGTLVRRVYANVNPAVNFVDEPLVYRVQDFQIRYVMDDGTMSDNPSAGVDGIPGNADDDAARLRAVRQIRFTISVISAEKDDNNRPYTATMTSTFSTRNLGYEAN
jgi:prepilin-type N-terminal cleavage/methylation domain-containing protein